tara:strand:+ start:371 stop:1222 length:852 start_codon:yes stop_codon:yes gene_type:complete
MLTITQYWKNSLKQKKPGKFIISKLLIRLKISKYFTIKQEGYKLHFFPSALSRVLWIDPTEPHTASIFFSDYLKDGDVVIDIGSNIGTVTIQSSVKVGKSGKIFSIEPNPKIYEFLLENLKFNNIKNVETFNIALGDSEGEINFSDKVSDVVNSIVNDESGIKVRISTLDKLLTVDKKINLLKIDVQGYDKFVLLGGRDILKKTDCVHFPVINQHYENFGYTYKDIFEIFRDNGFRIYGFTQNKKIWMIDEGYIPDDGDLLAIRNIDNFLLRTNYSLDNNKTF